MRVPTLLYKVNYVAVFENGEEITVTSAIPYIQGTSNTKFELEYKFGVKCSVSSIYNCIKKYKPVKFPYGIDFETIKGYLNWVLNCKDKKGFFEDCDDKDYWINNNDIVDVLLSVDK